MPSLTSLAEELLAQAKKLDAILEQSGTPYPSFEHDTLEKLPKDAHKLRKELTDTSHAIQQLARGARLSGLDIAFSWIDMLILRIVWQYKLASAVPIDGYATHDQIAAASGLSRSLVVRTVRSAISLSIFDEPRPGEIRHTAISRLLAADEAYYSAIGLQVQDLGPASMRLIEAWEKFGADAGEPDQSAFSLANGGRSLFAMLSEDAQMAKRFNLSMEYFFDEEEFDSTDIVEAFDWHSLDNPGSRLIDLGGNYGHASQMLAKSTQNMNFIVQDLPRVVEEGRKRLSPEFSNRIRFEECDFLQPRKAEDPPDAFLISRCLHDWSDQYCVTILRGLIPALQRGTKVLIWDVVLEDKPVKKMTERFNLQQDFIMATVANGKDRSLAEFQQVLKSSDERFKVDGIRRLDGCKLSMIEVTWQG